MLHEKERIRRATGMLARTWRSIRRAQDLLTTRLDLAAGATSEVEPAEALAARVRDRLAAMPAGERRLTSIMAAPVMAEIEAGLVELTAYRDEIADRIARLKSHHFAASAYARRRGTSARN